jgi:hypothetical protein
VTEHELERLARGLGERAAARLDVEATARAVVEGLREVPQARRVSWVRPGWLRIAAVLALLLGGGVALQRIGTPSRLVGAQYPLEDLSDLTVTELTQVLAGLESTLEGNGADDAVDLEDLTPAQLQALLRSLET